MVQAEAAQGIRPHRLLGEQRHHGVAAGVLLLDRFDMGQLALCPQLQQRRADRGLLQTVVL
jgi:hypothetical protein